MSHAHDVRVRFEPSGLTVVAAAGTTLASAAQAAGVTLETPCAGTGRCGKCHVHAGGELSPPSPEEHAVLGDRGIAAGVRLGCHARARGDVTVRIRPTENTRAITFGVALASDAGPVDVRDQRREGPRTGAAVDLGTTTIAALLIDLDTGAVLERSTALNPQVADGHDVLSRVMAAANGKADLLRGMVTAQIERLILGMLLDSNDRSRESLERIVVVGNTAMTGLFLGKDIGALVHAPYLGAHRESTMLMAPAACFESLLGHTEVWTAPAASAFIGGDITAGLLATGSFSAQENLAFIDLGTNGEIVLATGGRLLAVSAAAGPALEGASISCGMRAEPGAVERVLMTVDDLTLTTVDSCEPLGICGSGLLDLVAVLLDANVIDASGRLAKADSDRPEIPLPLAKRICSIEGMSALRVAPGVHLSQQDIRQVQLAKSAVRSALDLALDAAGTDTSEIERVVVAGGFGYHVRAEALTRIGMIPTEWLDRVEFVGNAALEGARQLLVSAQTRANSDRVTETIRTVDLAGSAEFQERFISNLEFNRS